MKLTSVFLTERCLTAFGMTMIVGMEGINGGGWAATKNPLLLAKFAVISTEGRNLLTLTTIEVHSAAAETI